MYNIEYISHTFTRSEFVITVSLIIDHFVCTIVDQSVFEQYADLNFSQRVAMWKFRCHINYLPVN